MSPRSLDAAGLEKMDVAWRAVLWRQFGAAIDMLENAIVACPENVWGDRSRRPEFWYVAYHTIFFLDYYLSESEKDFAPPAPLCPFPFLSPGCLR